MWCITTHLVAREVQYGNIVRGKAVSQSFLLQAKSETVTGNSKTSRQTRPKINGIDRRDPGIVTSVTPTSKSPVLRVTTG